MPGNRLRPRFSLPWKVAATVIVVLTAGVSAIGITVAHGAHPADIAPYASLAGGVFALLGVWWNLAESGRRRDDDLARAEGLRQEDARMNEAVASRRLLLERDTAKSRLLGCATSVHRTLSYAYQTARMPVNGFTGIDRFIDVAYGNDVADLATDHNVSTAYFYHLTRFEFYISALRLTQRLYYWWLRAALDSFYLGSTSFGRAFEDSAISAAKGAAYHLDAIRAAFGNTEPYSESSVSLSSMAHSVRRARVSEAVGVLASATDSAAREASRDLIKRVNRYNVRRVVIFAAALAVTIMRDIWRRKRP
jgi:hypothetical protein